MSRWQDEVSLEEWEEWQKIARRASHRRTPTSINNSQDLESAVMEKLMKAEKRPENVEAWIRTVAKTTFIDMWRTRSKFKKVDIDDMNQLNDQEFSRIVSQTITGPKSMYLLQEQVQELLGTLTEKDQRLVLMTAAGFTTQEIADELGYGSPNAVSNRLRRLRADSEDQIRSFNKNMF